MKTLRTTLLSVLMLIGVTSVIYGQSLSVSGVVTDQKNQPLAGVTVLVKNTQRGAQTDARGLYKITASKGEILMFLMVGYAPQEIKITGPVHNVTLHQAVQAMEEVLMEKVVVVTGHRPVSRTMRTGSSATVRGGVDVLQFTAPEIVSQASFDTQNAEEYSKITENRFKNVVRDPLSTFSLDVDGASYSNVRRMVNRGAKPTADAVRVEEFVNYFSYDYAKPQGLEPLRISYEIGACPWNAQNRLVRIGVKAREIPSKDLPATNFVFLIDVSGSMYERLELVKSSLKLLVNNLRATDRIAIVTYAGAAGEALPSTPGSDKQRIREALDNLEAGGSTAGGAGIQLAYKIARQNFVKGGNNRIILATDGDFNVGISSPEGLQTLIEQERRSGIFLTVLGYGMGNYKDKNMQTLAEKGNGNYAYIDNIQEANKVLVNEFGSTMHTVAKDVKLQVEFNPQRVQAYRLVGYESRLLNDEDFNDDAKDAGEIGAGHSVTALYEIVPVGVVSGAGTIDPLKYTPNPRAVSAYSGAELMNIKLRYKAPDRDVSRMIEVPVLDNQGAKLSEDFYFASAVAMFAQLLRDSDFKGDATYDKVIEQARKGLSNDENGYRREFIRLVESVKGMN